MLYRALLISLSLILVSLLSAARLTPDAALEVLVQGNQKFAKSTESIYYTAEERRAALVKEHEPIAAILCCSDARVSAELIFDQPIGQLFTVELAGNVASHLATESLEYAVQVLSVPLIIVMGHEGCGAVKAAIAVSPDYHGLLSGLVNMIEPAVRSAEDAVGTTDAKKLLNAAIQENVRINAETIIASSPTIADALKKKNVRMVLAEFHLDSGRVEWLNLGDE